MAGQFKPTAIGKKKRKMPIDKALKAEAERTTGFSKKNTGGIKLKSY